MSKQIPFNNKSSIFFPYKKNIILLTVLSALIIFNCFYASAQTQPIYELTEENGLPSNTIYQVLQDKKGFIWYGTDNGLFVFNGYEYLPIKGTGINDTEILKLGENSQGQIWFLNNSNQLFYVENFQAKVFAPSLYKEKEFVVQDFLIDKEENNLWLILESGKGLLKKIKVLKGFKKLVSIDLPFNSHKLYSMSVDKNYLLFSSSYMIKTERVYNIGRVNKRTLNFENFKSIKPGLANDEYLFTWQAEPKLGLAWSKVETFFVEDQKLIKTNCNVELGKINNAKLMTNGEWILLTQKGVFSFDYVDKTFKETGVIGNISDFCESEDGVIFYSSLDNGIKIVNSFNSLELQFENQEVLSIYLIDESTAIIGMSKGQFSKFAVGSQSKIEQLSDLINVRIINDYRNDTIFLGGDQAVYLYNKNTQSISIWQKNGNVKFIEPRLDDVFILGDRNLRKSDIKLVSNYNHLTYSNNKILFQNATSIYKDSNKDIWIGTNNGLFLSKENTKFQYVPIGEDTMSINRVVEMNPNELVVATSDKLFCLKNLELKYSINISKGTNFFYINDLKFKDSLLYVATNQGVAIFNPQTQEIIDWINKYDGLPSNDVNTIALGGDNKLWIGTKKGLAIVDLTKLRKNTTPPPIYITNIKVMEQDTTLQDAYRLPYNQNSIQIDYVGLAYRARGDVRYQYRMKGIDTTWVTTTSRYARFPGLSSGEYTFEVIALNEDDTPSAQAATVSFEIRPPYWMTWWFWGAGGLVIFGALGWTAYRRYKRLKRERAFEKQIAALKMEALQSQMNPHFIFNALNAVQSFITSGEDEQAMFYLAKFAKLIRSIFEYSGQTSISLDEEIDFLNLYLELERLRFGDKVNAAMFVEPELLKDAQDIYVPPLLIQPIVENAFKHGLLHKKGIGNLSIKFTFASDTKEGILCIIEDDGVGREYTKALKKSKSAHNSAGLTVTKNRLSILHKGASLPVPPFQIKDLVDQKQKAIGTRVEIIL